MHSFQLNREKLIAQINEWNNSRLDLFAISFPNEKLDFHGVMRFFFQGDNKKFHTKCLRVASISTTKELVNVLIEKFHPDVKTQIIDRYGLYETHPNGERRLTDDEYPLIVQLNWSKNDREGKFLLKNESRKTEGKSSESGSSFKRKWSYKRDRRRKNSLPNAADISLSSTGGNGGLGGSHGDESCANGGNGVGSMLPDSTFTRTISNPEEVMRRKRQQKLESKLLQITRKGEMGGALKIYGDSLNREIPYKTLLLAVTDPASYVVRETLDKYGLEGEDPDSYCLVLLRLANGGGADRESILADTDCPLALLNGLPGMEETPGPVIFQVRRRPAHLMRKRPPLQQVSPLQQPLHRHQHQAPLSSPGGSSGQQPASSATSPGIPSLLSSSSSAGQLHNGGGAGALNCPTTAHYTGGGDMPELQWPYLVELEETGADKRSPALYRLPVHRGEVHIGTQATGDRNIVLPGRPDMAPRHCIISLGAAGGVVCRPCSTIVGGTSGRNTKIWINNRSITTPVELCSGAVLRLGRATLLRFVDPLAERKFNPPSTPVPVSISQTACHLPTSVSASSALNNHNNNLQQPLANHQTPPQQFQQQQLTNQKSAQLSPLSSNHKPTTDPLPRARLPSRHTWNPSKDPVNALPATARQAPAAWQRERMVGETSSREVAVDLLPAQLAYREDQLVALLDCIIAEAKPSQLRFKLAPACVLYLVLRACFKDCEATRMPLCERDHRLHDLLDSINSRIHRVIQHNRSSVPLQAFWMANASELLHLVKRDVQLSGDWAAEGRDKLADAVQWTFHCILAAFTDDLSTAAAAFLSRSDADAHEDLSQDDIPLSGRPVGPRVVSDVIRTLTSCMTSLRQARVNAALSIQLFSQLLHFLNMWLFNRLVTEPHEGLICREWGRRILRRVDRVKRWARRQGLELAADCHLQRIEQACQLMIADKSAVESLYNTAVDLIRLNSVQLRVLLESYRPALNESAIPDQWIDFVVSGAAQVADRLCEDEGHEVRLEEAEDLSLPLLLPEDGYACDLPLVGVPAGLFDLVQPAVRQGWSRLQANKAHPSAKWTAYMRLEPNQTSSESSVGGGAGGLDSVFDSAGSGISAEVDTGVEGEEGWMAENERDDSSESPTLLTGPNTRVVSVRKWNNSLGLSIVAARAEDQQDLGIYIKAVVPNGAADRTGQLAVGDQLLAADGVPLRGLAQENAARVLAGSGQTVALTVAVAAAQRHALHLPFIPVQSAPPVRSKSTPALIDKRPTTPSSSSDTGGSGMHQPRRAGSITPQYTTRQQSQPAVTSHRPSFSLHEPKRSMSTVSQARSQPDIRSRSNHQSSTLSHTSFSRPESRQDEPYLWSSSARQISRSHSLKNTSSPSPWGEKYAREVSHEFSETEASDPVLHREVDRLMMVESTVGLTDREEERLERLRVEVEFRKRRQEYTSNRHGKNGGNSSGSSDGSGFDVGDTVRQEVGTHANRAVLLRSMRDNLERSLEHHKHKDTKDSPEFNQLDKMIEEKKERVVTEFEQSRVEERHRQEIQMKLRIEDQERWLKRQQALRAEEKQQQEEQEAEIARLDAARRRSSGSRDFTHDSSNLISRWSSGRANSSPAVDEEKDERVRPVPTARRIFPVAGCNSGVSNGGPSSPQFVPTSSVLPSSSYSGRGGGPPRTAPKPRSRASSVSTPTTSLEDASAPATTVTNGYNFQGHQQHQSRVDSPVTSGVRQQRRPVVRSKSSVGMSSSSQVIGGQEVYRDLHIALRREKSAERATAGGESGGIDDTDGAELLSFHEKIRIFAESSGASASDQLHNSRLKASSLQRKIQEKL